MSLCALGSFAGYVGLNHSPCTVFAVDIVPKDDGKVAKGVYLDFVPKGLKNGALKAKPDPLVVGKGLGKVQEGLDVQRKGVSAKKVVISDIQA